MREKGLRSVQRNVAKDSAYNREGGSTEGVHPKAQEINDQHVPRMHNLLQ
jgi:hypothetical protein